jgi:hypothetical protein
MRNMHSHGPWRALRIAGAVGLSALLVVIGLQLMDMKRIDFQNKQEGAGATAQQTYRHNPIAAGQQLAAPGRESYQAAALANLTAYKNSLLSSMVPLFDSKINGTQGAMPAVDCN